MSDRGHCNEHALPHSSDSAAGSPELPLAQPKRRLHSSASGPQKRLRIETALDDDTAIVYELIHSFVAHTSSSWRGPVERLHRLKYPDVAGDRSLAALDCYTSTARDSVCWLLA